MVRTLRVQLAAEYLSTARALRTSPTKDEQLLRALFVANGGRPARLGPPAALSNAAPLSLRHVEEHDVVEGCLVPVSVEHSLRLSSRLSVVASRLLVLLLFRLVLECTIVLASVDHHVLVVAYHGRSVIASRHWPLTDLVVLH